MTDAFTSYALQNFWATNVLAHDVLAGIRALPLIRINLCRGDPANPVIRIQHPGQSLSSIFPVVEASAPNFAPSMTGLRHKKILFLDCGLLPYQWVMRFRATRPGLYVIREIDITITINGRTVKEWYPVIWYEQ